MPSRYTTPALLTALASACCAALLGAPARAQSFPSTLPPAPQPRYSGIRLFYLDEHGGALYLGDGQLRLEGFYRAGPSGLAADLQYQYTSGFTPAVMDGRTLWQTGLATHDLRVGVGWRLGEGCLQLTPELNLRGVMASGVGGDSYWGISPALIGEYMLFPEATTIQLRVEETLPFSHSGNGGPDFASSFIPLFQADLRMTYRVLRPWDVSVGFQARQLPSDLGRGQIFTSSTAWLRGFYIGTGILF